MSDVTHILSQIDQGDAQAAKKLLPLVYEELRKLAAGASPTKTPAKRSKPRLLSTKPTSVW